MLTQRQHFPDRESLRHFARLATAIWVFDVDNHGIWWANDAGLAFWEAETLDDLLARDFSSDSSNVRSRLRQIVDSSAVGSPVQDTWTLYPKGHPKTVVITFQPIVIGDGVNALLLEINRVLDLQGDDEALRMLEAIRTAALMVSTFTVQGKLLAQNPEALACYGPAFGQHGTLQARLTNPGFVSTLVEHVMRNQNFEAEHEVASLHGARRHRILARRGRDPVTGHTVVVLSEEDVTEAARLRSQMEELNARLEAEVAERSLRLRESEARYELATRAASIWDWQVLEDRLFVSPRFTESLGYDPESFAEQLAREGRQSFLFAEDVPEYHDALCRHLKAPNQTWEHEVRLKTRDGSSRWYSMRGIGVEGEGGFTARSVGLLTDITQRKELEATLFAAQRMEAVGRLTGGVAHDFNNLLTVIGGNAELLEISDEIDPDLTGAIVQAVQRGAQLTRHLLAYSRKQPLSPRRLDVVALLADLQKTLLRVLGEVVTIEATMAPDLWPVYADMAQTESAVLNIALNARDAMPGGGTLTLACRNLTVTKDQTHGFDLTPGDYVEFRLSDTGEGMSEQTQQRAFEPFFTTKEVGKGSGLGLSMVFGFSRQSGGDVRIDSIVGEGTTVAFCLPRAHSNARTDAAARLGSTAGRGERVLLLEDDSAVQGTLSRLLENLNYRVRGATTVAEARALLVGGFIPDLCLLDVVLPGGESGLDLAEDLRAAWPSLPILVMSGYPATDEDSWEARYDGFLQKPIHAPRLSMMLRQALDR